MLNQTRPMDPPGGLQRTGQGCRLSSGYKVNMRNTFNSAKSALKSIIAPSLVSVLLCYGSTDTFGTAAVEKTLRAENVTASRV